MTHALFAMLPSLARSLVPGLLTAASLPVAPSFLGTPGTDDFPVHATLTASELEVGGRYSFEVAVELGGDINVEFPWSTAYRLQGERRPILLIDAPDCVRLEGAPPDVLDTPDDFQVSYLHFPFGRRMLTKQVTVEFELIAEPGPDDTLGINVVGYLGTMGTDTRDDSRFVRRRLELPLTPGAQTRSDGRPAARSSWGEDRTLQIGDPFPALSLPDNEGRTVDLAEWVGKRSVLVTVYRRET